MSEKENHIMRRGLYLLLLLIANCSVILADTVYLRNGSTVRGTVLGFINGRFVVRLANADASAARASSSSSSSSSAVEGGEIKYYAPREVERIEIEGRSLDEARLDARRRGESGAELG
ncbi:MAG: hypothetical protein WKF30_12460 [Pyrinomonadaceae bacterium]